MTKAELINAISKDLKCTKSVAKKAIDCIVEQITLTLQKNDKITLTGFGTFTVTKRQARNGTNPKTGQNIQIKACRIPKFKPGKELKSAIDA